MTGLGGSFLFPLTGRGAAISQIMRPAVDNVMRFSAEVSSLTEAIDQVNAMFVVEARTASPVYSAVRFDWGRRSLAPAE